MDDNKKFWQRFAKLYAPFMKSNKKLYAEICQSIIPSLNKNMNVLELACGRLLYITSRIGNESNVRCTCNEPFKLLRCKQCVKAQSCRYTKYKTR